LSATEARGVRDAREQAGVAAGIASASRQVGQVLGVAVMGSVLAANLHGPLQSGFAAATCVEARRRRPLAVMLAPRAGRVVIITGAAPALWELMYFGKTTA
jgi:hypothetical protein